MNEINKKKVILTVEDEKILSDTLEEKLISEGYAVLKAFDGDEGLRIALENHPDLILLDILLPKVDGLNMLKKLRKDPWGANIPVIILTNVDGSNEIAEAMGINHDDVFEYLLKDSLSLSEVVSYVNKRLNINSNNSN